MAKNIEFKDFRSAYAFWTQNGFHMEDSNRYELSDVLGTTAATQWLPKVIVQVVKEAAEPYLLGTQLLTRINIPFGQQIQFSAVGALTAEDIAEGTEYPERRLQEGPGSQIMIPVGKSGLAVKLTEEMIRYSQFDVINMHLRAAGKALARHKEKKIWNMITNLGQITHDNTTPANSIFGNTTGRQIDGSANGSVTFDDIIDAWGQVVMNGFTPDTLIVHPLTWTMFLKDATMRNLAMQSGQSLWSSAMSAFTGSPLSTNFPWGAMQNGLGMTTQGTLNTMGITATLNNGTLSATDDKNFDQMLQSAPKLPGYWGAPLTILVSPMVPFNPRTKQTDVILCDRSELGVIVVDEEITTEEFDDPARDIKKIKLRERYGLGISNEGLGVAVMKNVFIRPNEIMLPAETHINATATISPITRTSTIS